MFVKQSLLWWHFMNLHLYYTYRTFLYQRIRILFLDSLDSFDVCIFLREPNFYQLIIWTVTHALRLILGIAGFQQIRSQNWSPKIYINLTIILPWTKYKIHRIIIIIHNLYFLSERLKNYLSTLNRFVQRDR